MKTPVYGVVMQWGKVFFLVITAVFINPGWITSADAFHDGGVGPCSGCHGGRTAQWQLNGADPSSTCLKCHAGSGSPDSHHVASRDGTAMSAGGDFYWLTKNFFWAGGSSPGDSHGHNIVARDFGFRQDIRHSVAPGGNYPSGALGCTSCHDPHGKKGGRISGSGSYGPATSAGTVLGNFRLLGGIGYGGGKQAGGYSFQYDAPVARQGSARKFGESDTSHADYGSGMTEWCRNCHKEIHGRRSPFVHPSGVRLGKGMVDNYNGYVKTGDLPGSGATSYLALVPFERGVMEAGQMDPGSTQGPDGRSMVMCLTCHRAHASAFRGIGRWDFDAKNITKSHPAPGDGGVTGNDVLYSYYGKNPASYLGSSQKTFCEKCHGR